MNLDRLERKSDWIGYLVMTFVAGWIACETYYNVSGLWGQRDALKKEAVVAEKTCEDYRQNTIKEALADADQFGKPIDWTRVKTCPKKARAAK